MKNVLMAAVVASMSFVGAASAGGLGYGGYGEYAIEAEAFEFGLNASYDVNAFTLGAEAVFLKDSCSDLGLDSVSLGVNYSMNENADIYGKVAFDDELAYDEATVGVSFSF